MSLVDAAGTATPDTSAPATATPGTEPAAGSTPPVVESKDWYYAENVKGEGERPEWLKEKYKTAADQAKAYTEIEKKLGAFKGAPESYDLTLDGHPEIKFSQEDPMLKDFLESAKKNGASQEYVTELLTTYAKALTANIPNVDVEMSKLGPNAKQDVQLLTQWASNNFSKDEFEGFKKMLTTANSVRFFEKVRALATGGDVAPPAGGGTPRETVEQVTKLVSDPQYDKSPEFRADVKKRLAAAMSIKSK